MKQLLLLALLILAVPVIAQEKITLTVPESNADYRIANLVLVYDDPATTADEGAILLDLKGTGNAAPSVSCRYGANTSPTGTFLINALNKSDLSSAYAGNATTGSLKQRVFHRLVVLNEAPTVCGKSLAGVLAGSVQ